MCLLFFIILQGYHVFLPPAATLAAVPIDEPSRLADVSFRIKPDDATVLLVLDEVKSERRQGRGHGPPQKGLVGVRELYDLDKGLPSGTRELTGVNKEVEDVPDECHDGKRHIPPPGRGVWLGGVVANNRLAVRCDGRPGPAVRPPIDLHEAFGDEHGPEVSPGSDDERHEKQHEDAVVPVLDRLQEHGEASCGNLGIRIVLQDFVQLSLDQRHLEPDPGTDGDDRGYRCGRSVHNERQLLSRNCAHVRQGAHGRASDQGVGIIVEEDNETGEEGRSLCRAGRVDEPLKGVGDAQEPARLLDEADETGHEEDEEEDVSVILVRKGVEQIDVEHIPEAPDESPRHHAGSGEDPDAERKFHHLRRGGEENDHNEGDEARPGGKALIIPILLARNLVQPDLHLHVVRSRTVEGSRPGVETGRKGAFLHQVHLPLLHPRSVQVRLPEERVRRACVVHLILPLEVRDHVERATVVDGRHVGYLRGCVVECDAVDGDLVGSARWRVGEDDGGDVVGLDVDRGKAAVDSVVAFGRLVEEVRCRHDARIGRRRRRREEAEGRREELGDHLKFC
mmetsp:Transcript_17557/g.37990  ORF Transcript_17557/g.37990 Transcript_17557/m.37990 type:complete len:565 (-) Transcript_17557:119-1813(-)